jgi:hypothetical protein
VIELIEGQWFNVDQIVSVKAIGKDKCILWTTGQPATEGHILEYDAAEVVQAIEEAQEEYVDSENIEEDEE